MVLCGHYYGGMIITGVAEQIAAKIRSLVPFLVNHDMMMLRINCILSSAT